MVGPKDRTNVNQPPPSRREPGGGEERPPPAPDSNTREPRDGGMIGEGQPVRR